MRRQEAIEIATKRTGQADPAQFIDLCAELGMLKLDEPKSAEQRACQMIGVGAVQQLDRAGLRIVEK